jgi:outer membrane lipoprotein-sorting protein
LAALSKIEKVIHSPGLNIDFIITSYNGGRLVSDVRGNLLLKGNKFKMDSKQNTVWYNGRTQWSLLKGSDEVNVSNPTASELQTINPYSLMTSYKNDYVSVMSRPSAMYNNKNISEVSLTARSLNKQIQKVLIYIDKQTNLPVFLSITQKNRQKHEINILSCKRNVSSRDSNYSFDKKKYPNVEVIDLR